MYTCVNHQYHDIAQRHCYLCEIELLVETCAEQATEAEALREALTQSLRDMRGSSDMSSDAIERVEDAAAALAAEGRGE